MNNEQFKVIYKGNLKEGFDINQVSAKFAHKFKLTPEKALKILQSQNERILNKQIDHIRAYKLKSVFESMGLQVRLERVALINIPKETSKDKYTNENISNKEKDSLDVKSLSDSLKTNTKNIKIDSNTQDHITPIKVKEDSKRPLSDNKIKIAYNNDGLLDKLLTSNSFSKNKAIMLLTLLALLWFWNKEPNNPGIYDENGNPDVIVFTIDQCLDLCDKVISDLNKRGVPFRELVIDPSDESDENVILWKDLGSGGFPFILSGKEKVIGNSQAQLASLLGKNFNKQYLTSIEMKYYDAHFYPDGSPKVVLYGTDWCGYCAKLRKDFKTQNIDFVDIDVEKSKNQSELMKTLEINGYPAVWIGFKRVRKSDIDGVQAELKRI